MTAITADGPRIAGNLLSVRLPALLEQRDRPLLLLFHGTGTNERDLAPFLKFLPAHFVFALLRGPFPHGNGFAWLIDGEEVSVDGQTRQQRLANPAATAVELWLSSTGLDSPGRPISVLGFSGGGAVALQLLRRRPARYDFGILLSTFLPDDGEHVPATPAHRPRVYWGYDPADAVVPASIRDRTARWLRARTTLIERPFEGLGHRVDEASIVEASAFIAAG